MMDKCQQITEEGRCAKNVMGSVTAEKRRAGVSPHFFRQHKPEKSAVLTPTPVIRMQRLTFHKR